MKLLNDLESSSPTFCAIPFYHIYGSASGDIVPCCEAQETIMNSSGSNIIDTWNNQTYKNLRQQLIKGEYPEACKVCWHNEKNGIHSNRLSMFNHAEYAHAKNIQTVNEDGSVNLPPTFVELKVSNFCNLHCKMCSPLSSYKRTSIDGDILQKFSDAWKADLENPKKLFDDLCNWPELWQHVETLQFSGGEPIINDEHYKLIESIPKEYKKNIRLRYATNLTYLKFKKYDLIDIWSKFKHVNIKVSIDGLYDVYNYIRLGANWNDVINNINILIQNKPDHIHVATGLTVQVYNVFQVPEYYDFFNDYKLSFCDSFLLQTPKYLNIGVFPDKWKDKLIKKLSSHWHDRSKAYSDYLQKNSANDKIRNKFYEYTREFENKYPDLPKLNDLIADYL